MSNLNWNDYMKMYMRRRRRKPGTEEEKPENYGRDWREYLSEKKRNPKMDISFEKWRRENGKVQKKPEMKGYQINFPNEEFNKKLDEILKDNSSIKGKRLKDLIYDILDRKGILTGEKMLNIYYDSIWAEAIEEIMHIRDNPYKKVLLNGEEEYIPI
ncbi:MAG: hypothetical protein ABIE36_00775 [Candidatus Diapherotrites archaeon]